MTQEEVIRALKNLGGKALKNDLMIEYFRLHFPPQIFGPDYLVTKNKQYDAWSILSGYVTKLILDGIIERKMVYVGFNDIDNKLRQGAKPNTIEYSIK